ncbi:MAG: O-antigen translocase, partial [Mucinivorans sp.]
MSEQQKSYRNIAKTTSIFGGVQIIQIFISLIRGKLIAVLLGAAGMGINTILVSVINLISQTSTLGLNFSAVRNISQAHESGDTIRFAKT